MGIRNVDIPMLELQTVALQDTIDEEWSAANDQCLADHDPGCGCYEKENTQRGKLLMALRADLLEAIKELKKKGTAVLVAAPKGR